MSKSTLHQRNHAGCSGDRIQSLGKANLQIFASKSLCHSFIKSEVRLCLPPLVPRTRGGLDGALGECPVCTWLDVGAPSAAPTAARYGDVGGGGTDSSSSTPIVQGQ